jgi:hypothetical protein
MLAIEFALDVRRILHILNFDDKLTYINQGHSCLGATVCWPAKSCPTRHPGLFFDLALQISR